MRTHEYGEAVTQEALDAATRKTLALLPPADNEALYERAEQAVAEFFCPCVTAAEDAAGGKPSTIRAALVSEVIRRVRLALPDRAEPTHGRWP
ncbi:MAG: hypothetical protein M0002_20340 [Rhodospirillales bacterium]|nr:hypothetical protein [Rhodospirillales bacterium]